MPTGSHFFLPFIEKIMDSATTEGKDPSILVELLALSCLLCIVTGRTMSKSEGVSARMPDNTAPAAPHGDAPTNILQKTLADLVKNAGSSSNDSNSGFSPSPELLTSLLPLLSNPQIKSKMNPTNMAAIFGLLNSLGGDDKSKKKSENNSTIVNPDETTGLAATATQNADKTN